MKTFLNLKIGMRLALAFAFVLTLLVAVIGAGLLRLTDLRDQLNVVVDNRYPKVLLASDIKNDVNVIIRNVRAMLIDKDAQSLRKSAADNAAAQARIAESMDKLDRSLQAPETRRIFNDLKDTRATFVADQRAFAELLAAGNKDGALELALGKMRKDQHSYQTALDALLAELGEQFKHAGEEGRQEGEREAHDPFRIGADALPVKAVRGWRWT